MGNETAIVFSGIAPHPPIMVPEVGGTAIAEVRGSIDAMAEFTRRVIESGAETVVLVSPHAPLERHGFVAYQAPTLSGDFADFRAPAAKVEFQLDQQLLSEIRETAARENYAVLPIENCDLDHGCMVPLYFLQRGGWAGQVIALGYSFLSNEEHLKFGACIRRAVDQLDRSVALIASGDLSHRLKPNAPAGYYPGAYAFDDQVVDALRRNVPHAIVDIDQDLRRTAGECGYRSMLVVLGAIREVPVTSEVLNYEAPFGVGYLVAQLTNSRASSGNTTVEPSVEAEEDTLSEILPSLAREAVEAFVLTGKATYVPDSSGLLAARAACFVSIKTRAGDLRGCIGTIEPVNETLAEEVVMNAINAASRDPRFMPVTPDELEALCYSVDILGAAEPTTMEGLDPAVYGVIVQDESGNRRGLLLPAIEGVDTAASQVRIAARKAGISPGTPLKLGRFKVQRFREQEAKHA
jgi:AmmeMemoRadiSam system protein A/AmmeMemoRadiSam system protein B